MIEYLSGFLNNFESESIPGSLPRDCNSPQIPPMGLYAEQINNSSFTSDRNSNFKAWLYKILPSVKQCGTSSEVKSLVRGHNNRDITRFSPDQLRWDPIIFDKTNKDFVNSIVTIAYNDISAVHMYCCDISMDNSYFYNADGDWLIVPQTGALLLETEMGSIEVMIGEIAVIPRGIKYQVKLLNSGKSVGYICEINSSFYNLPERGVIGANGLAEERHFLAPTARYEEKSGNLKLYVKFSSRLWKMNIDNSPLDVVSWHGNLYPYKYNLNLFSPVNSVLRDHSDPSIFTVLTASSAKSGCPDIDFVIFPPRWLVSENTFRPPYYHRNVMSEFMGLIYGEYDAKKKGFSPGGISIHNQMSPHGVDSNTFDIASRSDTTKPVRYSDTLAFMFESRLPWEPTEFALNNTSRQENYVDCWKGIKNNFSNKTHI